MSNYLKNNAYQILGLFDTFATQRDIRKQSKEITQLLAINKQPKYGLDFDIFKDRTRESVREAAQNLSAPQKRIIHTFFWFQSINEKDKEAIECVKNNDIESALNIWNNKKKGDNVSTLLKKKNRAILLILFLFQSREKEYLDDSLYLWKELIYSDEFWKHFIEYYLKYTELKIDQSLFEDFRRRVGDYIADIYTDLSHKFNDHEYIEKCSEILKVKGEMVKKEYLEPTYQKITKMVEEIENMEVSADGVLDKEESQKIQNLIQNLQEEFNKLIDLGLYEDNQTKEIRDRVAEAIRILVLDLHNNLDKTDKSISLLEVARKFVGSSSTYQKIDQDLNVLKEIRENREVIKPVNDLIDREEYDKALEQIKIDREKYKNNNELQKFYDDQKKLCVTLIAMDKHKKARDFFNSQNDVKAKPLFEGAGGVIYENIDLFTFNKEAIDKIIGDIKNNLSKVNFYNLDRFDKYRNSFIEIANKQFEGQLEKNALIILVDSYIYGGIIDFIQRERGKKNKQEVVNVLIWLGVLTVWFYGIGIIFWVIAFVYSISENNE